MNPKITTECRNCNEETNHLILYKKEVRPKTEKGKSHDGKEWWCVTQCAGCNSLHFVLRIFFNNPEENNRLVHYDSFFPDNPENPNFISGSDLAELPSMIFKLYYEVMHAFDSESPVLAGVGLRTLVEAICKQQNIKGRNLKERIISLQAKGQISATELPILDKLRDIGNISAHEIKSFSMDKLSYALEIVNHVIRSIYILPKINKKLKL
ncbi:MAG: DUF4145 domain-containing protein [Flavobacterium sp.]|nr:DUF4145 domain-containing protein [Flavobacterium sp.]